MWLTPFLSKWACKGHGYIHTSQQRKSILVELPLITSWSSLYKWCGLTDLHRSIGLSDDMHEQELQESRIGETFYSCNSISRVISPQLLVFDPADFEKHPQLWARDITPFLMWFLICRLCKCCLHSSSDGGPLLLAQHSRVSSICIRFHVNQTERAVYGRQIGGAGGMRSLFPSSVLFPEMQSVCYHLGDTWACRWGFPCSYQLITLAGLAPVRM